MSSELARALTLKQIKRLAGDRSFKRGERYFSGGRVCSLVVSGNTLTASVIGTENYSVRLSARDGTFSYHCTCPMGVDDAFCKHSVAVALAWLDAVAPANNTTKATKPTPLVSLDDLRPWLLDQPSAMLAGYLLEAAERDERLREKLLRNAARATDKGIDVSTYRRAIDRATRTGGFIDYYGAGGYATAVNDAIEPLRDLLADTPDQAAAVIELIEHALKRVENAIEIADDSNGEIGSLLETLQELHLDACKFAKPDPDKLARRLFTWETEDHWDVFYNAVATYADLLGKTGINTYRQLAETAWAKLPVRNPGDREDYDNRRFRLTGIMEALAQASGDVDALVAIKAKDLSSPYHYLQIAELLHTANRHDDALSWAERGAKAFPDRPDPSLAEFLANEYHRLKRHGEAIELIWQCFERSPCLDHYQRLKHHADHANDWSAYRERALKLLRGIKSPKTGPSLRRSRWSWQQPADNSLLVEILLWENNFDDAWAEAITGGCSRPLWLRLAAIRQKDHPGDALQIFMREAEEVIDRTNRDAYKEAIGHLKKAKSLYLQLGQAAEWNAVLTSLRTKHKAKRNFIALAADL